VDTIYGQGWFVKEVAANVCGESAANV